MRGVDSTYLSHVRDLYGDGSSRDAFDLQRLFGAGEAVQSVVRHPGWSVLMDVLSAERENIRGRIEGAKPLEAAEVQHLLGQLRGINAVELAATALLERYRVELEEQQRKHESTGESVAA